MVLLIRLCFLFSGHKFVHGVAQRKGKERTEEVPKMSFFQYLFLQKGL
jgi:hypothetical protein